MAFMLQTLILCRCLVSSLASVEACSADNSQLCSSLLQGSAALTKIGKGKAALTDLCDDWQPRKTCSSKARLKQGEGYEDTNAVCLQACSA
eukprot:CAMPEP_0180658400 /NCGR_PEP_ID=MMETSP1037_2-20121125/56981_1 /TAXON_ID=632150 /ORGANISM="Azadinium spinosum, Strain 3D9" /LENGTH=90 /DNA_ID=CAMNT_0022685279 /DNA_START=20 /DNA_END=289 /DNA_ORIENTATION=-